MSSAALLRPTLLPWGASGTDFLNRMAAVVAVHFLPGTSCGRGGLPTSQGGSRASAPARPPRVTIVDLSGLSFADCALLRVVVLTRFRSRLVLVVGRRHKVRRIFECTCTERLFTFVPDVDTALRMAIGGAPPRAPEAAGSGRF